MKEIVKGEGEVFDIDLEADILRANEEIAEKNKELLRKHGVKAIDVMGSIGSGKTSLILQLVKKLKEKHKIAVFNGDLTTTIDSDLIGKQDVEVVQINTGKECHLDANLVKKALQRIDLNNLELLFIENVGNLICPVDFPLGSEKRVVVISVTEGPYIAVKHPSTFMGTDVVAINKMDLAMQMEVNVEKLEMDVKSINPNIRVAKMNCRTGDGINELIRYIDL
ncbi:MAG: hydrogenase nickel incorporation protein HypB [Candidatus Bathyarchaeota archaeon]